MITKTKEGDRPSKQPSPAGTPILCGSQACFSYL